VGEKEARGAGWGKVFGGNPPPPPPPHADSTHLRFLLDQVEFLPLQEDPERERERVCVHK
jgi:hypothetical protein